MKTQRITPMEELAVNAGRKALAAEYVHSWHFRTYAPPVSEDTADFSQFNAWFEKVGPESFEREFMFKLFAEGEISFKSFKEFMKDDIYEEYKTLVERYRGEQG